MNHEQIYSSLPPLSKTHSCAKKMDEFFCMNDLLLWIKKKNGLFKKHEFNSVMNWFLAWKDFWHARIISMNGFFLHEQRIQPWKVLLVWTNYCDKQKNTATNKKWTMNRFTLPSHLCQKPIHVPKKWMNSFAWMISYFEYKKMDYSKNMNLFLV
jgi:hypothetical protein